MRAIGVSMFEYVCAGTCECVQVHVSGCVCLRERERERVEKRRQEGEQKNIGFSSPPSLLQRSYLVTDSHELTSVEQLSIENQGSAFKRLSWKLSTDKAVDFSSSELSNA